MARSRVRVAGRNARVNRRSPGDTDHHGIPKMVLWIRLTTFVVDPVTTCLVIERQLLELLGVPAESVNNWEDALHQIILGANYDSIIVDGHMPEITGVDTVRRLRKMGIRSMIIGVTSGSIRTDRTVMMNAGANGCIKKPLHPDVLASILAVIDGQRTH